MSMLISFLMQPVTVIAVYVRSVRYWFVVASIKTLWQESSIDSSYHSVTYRPMYICGCVAL
jgi:hypothetical protein